MQFQRKRVIKPTCIRPIETETFHENICLLLRSPETCSDRLSTGEVRKFQLLRFRN